MYFVRRPLAIYKEDFYDFCNIILKKRTYISIESEDGNGSRKDRKRQDRRVESKK